MSSLVYNDLWASCVVFCNTMITAIKTASLSSDMEFVNLDAHADLTSLSGKDVLGMKGFALNFSEQVIDVTVLFGVSTLHDTNLLRLNKSIAMLVNELFPTSQIAVKDADTGAVLGWMVVQDGTAVLPVASTTSRPIQYVMVTMATSQFVS